MARISDIVGKINDTIKENQFSDRRFQKGTFYGIAEVNESDDGEDFLQTYPAINDNSGDSTLISVDDRSHWWLYHRIEDVNIDNEIEEDFGAAKGIMTTYDMICVLWADKRRLQLDRTQLLTGLVSGFPSELIRSTVDAWDLQSVAIRLQGCNIDAPSVYRGEYTTRRMPLSTNHVMIAQRYEVETVHRQGCLDVCSF